MTATKRKTKGEKTLIKKLLISLAAGLGACLAVSLAGAVVAVKMGNALSLFGAAAAGTLLGFLAFCFKKPNTKKKLKKYIKNA